MDEDSVRLSHQAPYDWPATLAFLGARAIDGVEQIESAIYRRTKTVQRLARYTRRRAR